ncbi:unnamed protein product [Phytophthora lilii]|uniref:RxLR effector protein n=1 Tax=Phytophthora lilii TaxID=2077276 RepID=A0A9W6WTJ5_9STRA|nr:unnamed protein product [Phytophthora lilii]
MTLRARWRLQLGHFRTSFDLRLQLQPHSSTPLMKTSPSILVTIALVILAVLSTPRVRAHQNPISNHGHTRDHRFTFQSLGGTKFKSPAVPRSLRTVASRKRSSFGGEKGHQQQHDTRDPATAVKQATRALFGEEVTHQPHRALGHAHATPAPTTTSSWKATPASTKTSAPMPTPAVTITKVTSSRSTQQMKGTPAPITKKSETTPASSAGNISGAAQTRSVRPLMIITTGKKRQLSGSMVLDPPEQVKEAQAMSGKPGTLVTKRSLDLALSNLLCTTQVSCFPVALSVMRSYCILFAVAAAFFASSDAVLVDQAKLSQLTSADEIELGERTLNGNMLDDVVVKLTNNHMTDDALKKLVTPAKLEEAMKDQNQMQALIKELYEGNVGMKRLGAAIHLDPDSNIAHQFGGFYKMYNWFRLYQNEQNKLRAANAI